MPPAIVRGHQPVAGRRVHDRLGVLDLLRVPGNRLDYALACVSSAVWNLFENRRPLLLEAGTGLLRSLRDPVAESVLELFKLVQRPLDA